MKRDANMAHGWIEVGKAGDSGVRSRKVQSYPGRSQQDHMSERGTHVTVAFHPL